MFIQSLIGNNEEPIHLTRGIQDEMTPPRSLIPGTALSVSPICLGVPGFGTVQTGPALEELFDRFIAAGGNFFDTAHCYAVWREEPGAIGASERTLGRLVRNRGLEKEIVIETKGGHPSLPPRYVRPDRYLSPELLLSDVRDSIERLGLERLDLFLLHRDDLRVPVDEIMDALSGIIAAGLIRHAGASNWTAERIAAANEYARRRNQPGLVISSPSWNLAQRNPGTMFDPTMRELTPGDEAWHVESRLPVMCYNASAGGWFAAESEGGPYDNPVSRARRARCAELGQSIGATPGQVALAWLRTRPFDVFPIIGTTRPAHLDEAMGAARLRLTPEQAQWLRDGDGLRP